MRGVGLELMWAVHDLGYEVIFGLGLNERVRKIYSTLGFEILPDIPRWIGVFDIARTARLLGEADPEGEVSSLRHLCAEYFVDTGDEVSSNTGVKVVDWNGSFAVDWDSFWSDHLAPSLVGPNKDSLYLNWRYIGHPAFKYEIRLAQHAATRRVVGLTIFRVERIRERDERVLRVVEFLSTPEAEGPLARSVVRAAQDHEVIFADFYCTSGKVARALESIGFRRCAPDGKGAGFPSHFQPLEPGRSKLIGAFWLSETLRSNVGELLALEDFYVTRADSDQDRPN